MPVAGGRVLPVRRPSAGKQFFLATQNLIVTVDGSQDRNNSKSQLKSLL
jgi:hypothetical protein